MKLAGFQDDIVMAICSCEQHFQDIRAVLRKLVDKSFRLNKEKHDFMAEVIVYLGLASLRKM